MKVSRFINSFSFIIFIFTTNYINSQNFIFPTSVTTYDNTILVIDRNGTYICNQALTSINQKYIFSTEDQIKNEEDLSRVVLKRTKGYIIGLINYKIFFFSGSGELLKISSKFTEENLKYYSIIPYTKDSDNFYFLVGFFDSNNKLNI